MSHFLPENLPESIRHFIGHSFVPLLDASTFPFLPPFSPPPSLPSSPFPPSPIDLSFSSSN